MIERLVRDDVFFKCNENNMSTSSIFTKKKSTQMLPSIS